MSWPHTHENGPLAGREVESAGESAGTDIVAQGASVETITLRETWDVLTKITGVDGVARGDVAVRAWHEILQGITFQDAVWAVAEHFRRSKWKPMPADLLALIEEAREEAESAQYAALENNVTQRRIAAEAEQNGEGK